MLPSDSTEQQLAQKEILSLVNTKENYASIKL